MQNWYSNCFLPRQGNSESYSVVTKGSELLSSQPSLIAFGPAYPSVVVLCFIFSVGGWHHRDAVSGVERYNPLQHEWRVLGSVSRPHRGAGVASLQNCIYAVGGFDGTTCLSSVAR